jgi:hypothetical protein
MPYKDPRRKQAWEQLNRATRLARRRELRRIAADREAALNAVVTPSGVERFPWEILAAGGALAFLNPPVALGAAAVTLVVAAVSKKDWQWWVIGAAILLIALFFLQKEPTVET